MPDEDIEMFKNFQIGLYTKEIQLADKAGKEINSDILVDLHILEEARGIPDLQNAAIDAFIAQLLGSRQFPTGLIRHVFGNTAEKSPLRRLFVDMCHCCCKTGYFDEEFYGNYSRRFLFDLAVAHCELAEGIGSKIQEFTADRSLYYVPSHN